MDELLYPRFATDFAAFLECERFWLDLVNDVLVQDGVVDAAWESSVDMGPMGSVRMDPPYTPESGGIVRGWSRSCGGSSG